MSIFNTQLGIPNRIPASLQQNFLPQPLIIVIVMELLISFIILYTKNAFILNLFKTIDYEKQVAFLLCTFIIALFFFFTVNNYSAASSASRCFL